MTKSKVAAGHGDAIKSLRIGSETTPTQSDVKLVGLISIAAPTIESRGRDRPQDRSAPRRVDFSLFDGPTQYGYLQLRLDLVAASISFFPDAGELADNRFHRNRAQGGKGGSRGGDGGSGVGGGVAALAGASLQIEDGVFIGNAAQGGNGGRGGDGGNWLGGGIGLSRLDTSVPSLFEGLPFIPFASVKGSSSGTDPVWGEFAQKMLDLAVPFGWNRRS